jgi:hypothetical protein
MERTSSHTHVRLQSRPTGVKSVERCHAVTGPSVA